MKLTREPIEWTSHSHNPHALGHSPVPPHYNHRHLPPHHLGHTHMPPHMRSSRIYLEYDETTIARINQLYGGNTDYVIGLIENCPPEIKLTWAITVGIKANLSEYPIESSPMVRFDTAFMTEENAIIIARALQCEEDVAVVMSIYNTCPPEQSILAIAAATLKQSGGGA